MNRYDQATRDQRRARAHLMRAQQLMEESGEGFGGAMKRIRALLSGTKNKPKTGDMASYMTAYITEAHDKYTHTKHTDKNVTSLDADSHSPSVTEQEQYRGFVDLVKTNPEIEVNDQLDKWLYLLNLQMYFKEQTTPPLKESLKNAEEDRLKFFNEFFYFLLNHLRKTNMIWKYRVEVMKVFGLYGSMTADDFWELGFDDDLVKSFL